MLNLIEQEKVCKKERQGEKIATYKKYSTVKFSTKIKDNNPNLKLNKKLVTADKLFYYSFITLGELTLLVSRKNRREGAYTSSEV